MISHVDGPIEKIGQFLFPEKIRHYLTFPLMTVFALVVTLGSFALNVLHKQDSSSGVFVRINETHGLVHSTVSLILQTVGLVLGFWLIYATRGRKQYYWLRVVFYGMLLSGLLSEGLSFL